MIATELGKTSQGEISVVDIGSRTIDILTFINGKPLYDHNTLHCI